MTQVETKFFHFRQNNSGGSFITRNGVDVLVIIEAADYLHANAIAESKGIYFHGCSSGRDCSCCGDRWDEVWDGDEGFTKEFNDRTLKQKEKDMKDGTDQYARHFIIYYLDGSVTKSRGRIINRDADRW